jgi:hypothetical protein
VWGILQLALGKHKTRRERQAKAYPTKGRPTGYSGDYYIRHHYRHRVDDEAVGDPQERGTRLNLAQGRRLFEKVRAGEQGRG